MRRVALALLIAFVAAPMAMAASAPVVSAMIYGALAEQPEVALLRSSGGTAASLSTTPVAPLADLSTSPNLRTAAYVQQVVVVNLDATGAVCVKAVPCTSTSCTATPVAGDFDCLGSHPGMIIPAGASRTIPVLGNLKLWAVASEPSTDVQLERTIYFGKQ